MSPNNLDTTSRYYFKKIEYSKAKDIEIHSGVSSLLAWIKVETLDNIKKVLGNPKSSLEDLHQILANYNLELKPRGNGIVIKPKLCNRNHQTNKSHCTVGIYK